VNENWFEVPAERCRTCGRSLLADEEYICVPCIKLGANDRKPIERVTIDRAGGGGRRRGFLKRPVEGGK